MNNKSRGNTRKRNVDDMPDKIQALDDDDTDVMNDIQEVIKEERGLKGATVQAKSANYRILKLRSGIGFVKRLLNDRNSA